MKNKNRYFHVSFHMGHNSFGHTVVECDNCFLNMKQFVDNMKKEHNVKQVIIISIFEMTKEDLEDFIK